MAHVPTPVDPRVGSDGPLGRSCLGRTCMKWSADGELAELDFQLVLERLGAVDAALGSLLAQEMASPS